MRSVARMVLTFLPVLAWLVMGFVQGPTAKAQEYQEGYPITGATFSSGPVSVTAWGSRSDILFVDMDVHVEESVTISVQTGQPIEGCLAETTSVASGAMLSGKPLTWLPVKSECFAEPVRFLLEGAGDIHLSFQAASFYSVSVSWVSVLGVSGLIALFPDDFAWAPSQPARSYTGSDLVQTIPTPASVTVDVKNPRVWVENGPEEATYRAWWDCGTGPRITAVEVYETRPYRGPSELPIPFEAGWVSITWDSPGHLLPCRDSLPIYSTSLVSRWVVVYALLDDGVLIVSDPFLFEPRA